MNVCVIGGGTWGSAFALHLGRKGIDTSLWIREKDIFLDMQENFENKTFLPGFVFPPSVSFSNNIKSIVKDADIVFVAVPSKFCRKIYRNLAGHLSSNQIIVSLTKGIEEKTLKRMSELVKEVFPPSALPPYAVLSGPSFAREVAAQHPTTVVVASKKLNLAQKIQHLISYKNFRAYTSSDIIGVELCGALKNVIAIATGISFSLGFGNNTAAALITRGIAEITRLGMKLGAKKETFLGLAGIGDLVLTCTGKLSRNRSVGYELGQGKTVKQIVSNMNMVAEGITTTLSAHKLAKSEQVELPICEQVYQVIYKKKSPREALQDLMSRKLKHEN
ncbi:MAG: NAD(P)H-dependent glycerol-3-phosphate dehydrogenase [Candidatus Aminicenantaceae bacterium]